MNILFTRFPLESAYGGAEIQTLSLMEGLRSRGHTVRFLGSCPVLLEKCSEAGFESTTLDIGPPPVTKWGAISFFWRQFGMKKKLCEALEEDKDVDVVCMLSLSEKILLTPYALSRNLKVLWIEHDLIGRWLKRNPWLPCLRRLSKFVTTIGVSDLSAKIIVADLGYPEERVKGIANGVDPSRLGKTQDERRKTQDGLTVGCIARLTPDKGVDVLIESCQVFNLRQGSGRQAGVRCQVVGRGRGEDRIRALLSSFETAPYCHPEGLLQSDNRLEGCCGAPQDDNKRIALLPSVPNLGDFYRSLDVFVLPSRDHDPFGLVAAEAMLQGVATIVTDACGIADYLVDGQHALIVEAGSSDAIADALNTLQDAELRHRIAENGKSLASERFNIEKMVDQYEHCMMEG